MAPENNFNSTSYDAVLSKLIERIDQQDARAELKRIEDKQAFKELNEKLETYSQKTRAIEDWQLSVRSKVAIISFIFATVGTGAGTFVFKKLFPTS
jgi:hypothetical protein